MGVLKAIAIGLVNAILGMFCAGGIAMLCVEWYRITSFEGASGYFVVMTALLGLVAGFFIGLIGALFLFAKRMTPPWAALGYVTGGTVLLAGMITAGAYLRADLPPKIDGRELMLEFEVRFPENFTPPTQEERAYVVVTRDHGNRSQRLGDLRFSDARREDGALIVPASVYLHTSDRGKALGVVVGDRTPQYHNLPVPAKPTRADMEWSAWLPGPSFGDLEKIPASERLPVRYRVQFYTPPIAEPETTPEEAATQ